MACCAVISHRRGPMPQAFSERCCHWSGQNSSRRMISSHSRSVASQLYWRASFCLGPNEWDDLHNAITSKVAPATKRATPAPMATAPEWEKTHEVVIMVVARVQPAVAETGDRVVCVVMPKGAKCVVLHASPSLRWRLPSTLLKPTSRVLSNGCSFPHAGLVASLGHPRFRVAGRNGLAMAVAVGGKFCSAELLPVTSTEIIK